MKTFKELFESDSFRKVCGKVIDFDVRRTVGFKGRDVIDYEETTYVLGVRIKKVLYKDVNINNDAVINTIKNLPKRKKNSKRVIVKGFLG